MRKILLSLLFSCLGMYAMGQNLSYPGLPKPMPAPQIKMPVNNTAQTTQTNGNGVIISRWFDNLDESKNTGVETYSGPITNTLFSDSSVQAVYSDGNGGSILDYVFTQGTGEVFDAQSQIYDTVLSLYDSYTVDSIRFPYVYHYVPEPDSLSADGVTHDTLIFQFYSVSSGGLFTGTAQASQGPPVFPVAEPYVFPKYNYLKNVGLSSITTVKYVMGAKDSTTTAWGLIQIPTDSVKGGIKISKITTPKTGFNTDLFAYTVSYRPGFKWKFGDTVDEQEPKVPNGVTIAHPHSHIRIAMGNSTSKDANPGNEMDLSIISPIRYNLSTYRGQPSSGELGAYIPGTLYYADNQILWSMFHITNTNYNLGIETSGDIKGYGLGNVYPNPANGSAKIDFSIPTSENVTITVYDMLGHELTTLAKGQYPQGTHTVNFSTENWKTGLYLYSISAGNYSKTLKFTVSE